MKISCEVIRDLLPLYAEGMASPDSAAIIEEHLAECESCRAELAAMTKQVQIPVQTETESILHLGQNIRRRRRGSAVLAMLVTASILFSLFMYLYGPVYLSVEEAVAGVTESDGIVTVEFTPVTRYCRWEDGTNPDNGREYATVIAARHRWNVLLEDVLGMEGRSQPTRMRLSAEKDIWYASTDNGEEDQLLWGREICGGKISLPRLVMGYYFMLALVGGVILLIPTILFRKKAAGKLLGILCALCFSFALSDLIATGGNWRIYDGYDVPILLALMVIQTLLMTGSIVSFACLRRTDREP